MRFYLIVQDFNQSAFCKLQYICICHFCCGKSKIRLDIVSLKFSNTTKNSFCSHKNILRSDPITKYARVPKIYLGMYTYQGWQTMTLLQGPKDPVLPSLMSKIQQTKMLVTCQRLSDLLLFGLVWQYSSVQTKYNKGRFKVMTTYLLAAVI